MQYKVFRRHWEFQSILKKPNYCTWLLITRYTSSHAGLIPGREFLSRAFFRFNKYCKNIICKLFSGRVIFIISRFCLLLLNLFLPLIAFPQEVSLQHYSVNDGLPQGSVYAIFQAKNGVMWIGTGDGLCRYDGANYSIYRKTSLEKNGLLHNRIRKIGEDQTGNIYVNSDVGLNIIEAFTGKIITPEVSNKSKTDSLFFLFSKGNEVFLVKNRTQLWRYHSTTKKSEIIAHLPFAIYNPHQAFILRDEIYYQIKQEQIKAFNYLTFSTRSIKPPNHPIINFYEGNGHLYIHTRIGAYQLLDNGKSFMPIPLKYLSFSEAIDVDKIGNTWLSSKEKGLLVYNAKGRKVYEFPVDYQSQKFEGLSLKDIKIIYIDHSGNVWVGTEGNGLVQFKPRCKKFNHVKYEPNNKYGLSTGFIKCFYRSVSSGKVPAGLWVGTYLGGINFMNTKGSFSHYLEGFTCFGITQDDLGNLWIASNSGIYIMDIAQGRFKRFKSFTRGYTICKFSSSDILYSDEAGTYIISPNKKNVFNSAVRPFKGCPPDMLTFHETTKGNLLMAIEQNGIYLSLHLLPPQKIGLNTILEKATVRSFYEIPDGRLYLATNAGLIVLNRNHTIKKIYSINEGLPNEVLYSVVPDEKKNLWISSNNGLSKFNIISGVFRNYSPYDGIQSNEFNTGAWFKDPVSEEIYMGGVNGYNVFTPGQILDNPNTPDVILSSIKVFDKDFNTDTVIQRKKNISLSYEQNSLTFEFTAPEFTNYDQNSYAYKLLGVDKNWIMAGHRRYATYGNLTPGNYVLMARASNNDGVWGDNKKVLVIVIHPPWWQTSWFYLLSIVTFIVLIWLLIYRLSTAKLRRQLTEMKRLQEIETMRSRISRDIHDDVGAGLSHLALSSDLALMKLGTESELSGRLTEISNNSRKLIGSLSEIIWSVNPRFDELSSMLSYMRSYISEYFENSEITTKTDIPETLDDRPVKPEIRMNIFLILKESLHNIVKHAHAKNVSIVFILADEHYELIIKDDGKGMDVNQTHEFGNGMINMKRRAEEIGGKLSLESKKGEGTCIIINGTFV